MRITPFDSEAARDFVSRRWGVGGGALASSFVEEDGGGSSGIEGFDRRGHGDTDARVGDALDFFGEALAFVADKEGDGAAPVDLPGSEERLSVGGGFAGAGGHDENARCAELFDGGKGSVADKDGQVEGGSRGSTQDFGGERAGRAALSRGGGNGGGSAEGWGGAQDGADVPGILYTDEDKNERGRAAFAAADDLFQRVGTRRDQSGYALGIFRVGDALKEAVGGVENGDCDFGTIEVGRKPSVMTRARFAEEDAANGASGAESLFDKARTFDADCAGFGGESAA